MDSPTASIALISLVCLSFAYFNHIIRRNAAAKETGVPDLPLMGQARPQGQKIKGTAVVCGGSVIGLLTARVCHDHFENVVIVEPGAWVASEDAMRKDGWNQKHSRSRIVQYNSLQAIQVFGFKAMSRLFPGLEEECEASDIRHVLIYLPHRHSLLIPYAEYNGNLPKVFYPSRAGLETLIRRLVLGGNFPNIRQVIGTVTGVSRTSNTLSNVSVRTDTGKLELEAAFVVSIDCTGPARAGLKWLEREGFGTSDKYPKGTLPLDQLAVQYHHHMHYATFYFRVPADFGVRLPIPGGIENCGSIYNMIPSSEIESCLIYTQRVDGNIIQVMTAMWGDDFALPTNLEEIKEYARNLRVDTPIPHWFFQFLDELDGYTETMTSSRVTCKPATHVRYHKATNLPSNWVAIGDSVMSVNPVFGQGINKGIMGIVSLNTMLRNIGSNIPKDFSKTFFEMQANKIEPIWQSTKTPDYGFKSTDPIPGETLEVGSFFRWYIRRIFRLASQGDILAGSTFWHSNNFLTPRIQNLQFRLIVKVLWDTLKHPRA
ncbi:hypothetical protein C8J56DRAFT_785461 [Mycena floridula]|nr:hypothetical protein C8J56DRAFT_785461 [Mycena floridula]